jgi:hypothetical protein
MLCQRVESAHAHPKGGWYHFYDSKVKPEFIPKPKEAPRTIDAEAIMNKYKVGTREFQYQALAASLGVNWVALVGVGAAWAYDYNAWAFPMRNGFGDTVGIRLRNMEGFKWAISGSRQGVFLPETSVHVAQPAFLPEGPTDTAALLSLGLYTIGRPTNQTGGEHLKVALKRLKINSVVIVADNDAMKRLGTREGRPGIEGAQKLAKELKMKHCIWIPPTKDARDFVKRGGTKTMIESDLKNKVWSK